MKLNPIVFELEQKINQYQTDLEAIRLSNQLALESCCQIEQKLRTSQQMLQLVMDTLPERIFWKDRTSSYLGCNQAFARDAGLSSPEELIGKNDYDLPWATTEADFYRQCDNRVMISGQAEMGIIESQLQSDGRQAWLETNKAPLRDPKGNIIGVLGTYQDITPQREAEIALQEVNQKLNAQSTELKAALQQLQDTQLQMVQQEKMSALGAMMAGIAHEINNPVGFLEGNLSPAETYIKNLLRLTDLYQQKLPTPDPEVERLVETIDLEYLREDLPYLLDSMKEGVKRIREISVSLRTFARADTEKLVMFDLQEGLDGTLHILKHRLRANEYRPTIQVVKHYSYLPPVLCFPGQLNQVFMNLIVNAIDALDEANHGKGFQALQANPNCLTLTIELSDNQEFAMIRVKDNGVGMTEETKQRIFESLFTTKAVGKGTGLGLAIARQIVVEKHHGTIEVQSQLGEGTEFTVQIPVNPTPTSRECFRCP